MHKFPVSTAILVAAMLTLILPAQVSALPQELQTKIGNVYVVSTITGEAKTIVGGQTIVVPAVLELKCRVTWVGDRFILFRIEGGSLRLDQTTCKIIDGWWRGAYDKGTEKSVIEAYAVDGAGVRIHFILFGDDARHTVGGTYMTIRGGLKDGQGNYWSVNIKAWRFKAS